MLRRSFGSISHRAKSSLFKSITNYSLQNPRKININDLAEYQKVQPNFRAKMLNDELKTRISHKIIELERFPYGLPQIPSIKKIIGWYIQSFEELDKSLNVSDNPCYNQTLKNIYERHSPTLMTMAKGTYEWKRDLTDRYGGTFNIEEFHHGEGIVDIESNLNEFYHGRISIRLLIDHYLQLSGENKEHGEHGDHGSHVGIISLKTLPIQIVEDAYDSAKFICQQEYGFAPEIKILGDLEALRELSIPYIPSHLYYVLFEILKNAMKATQEVSESSQASQETKPIEITLSRNDSEFVIKISDHGIGLSKSELKKIWSYFYTTADVNLLDSDAEFNDFDKQSPLAGFGYGLPISRILIRYFGGDIEIQSVKNHGTDVYIYL